MRLVVAIVSALLVVVTAALAGPPILDGLAEFTLAQWQAAEAIATWVIAGATVIGLVAIIVVYRQRREAQRRFRVELSPYIRIDFAIDEPSGTWTPPPADQIDNDLTFADLEPDQPTDVGMLGHWKGNRDICLWMRNLQERPTGVADNIFVVMELDVPDIEENVLWRETFEVTFAYLAPGQTARYVLASVSNEIPYLAGRITSVRYSDMYGSTLAFAHGSTEFEFREDRTMINERNVFRSE